MSLKINIENLLIDSDLVCFVVPSLFNKSECEELLNSKIRNGFQKAITNYPTYYRNNDRLVVDDIELSNKLFEKVKGYLPETIISCSNVEKGKIQWKLEKINSRIRFCRYSENQYFSRHLDGVYFESENIQSKLTFMIYLNDASEFEGGRTLFYKSKESEEIWAKYIPRLGDLIIFDHSIWHEGEILTRGEKYILRSDILYSKSNVDIPHKKFSKHLGYIWVIAKFDKNTILTGGRDKFINVWNADGDLLQSLTEHENSILCLKKINHNTFISGSRDRQLIVWRRDKENLFKQINIFNFHSALVLSICKLNHITFVSSSGDNSVKISNLDGEIQKEFLEHTNWVWQIIRISHNTIVSCSEDCTIKIWNIEMNNSFKTFFENKPIFCLGYVKRSQILLSGNLEGEISIRKLTSDFEELECITMKAHTGIVRTIKVLNNKLFASGGEDNQVKVWNIKSGECIFSYEHKDFVQSIELFNRNTLLSASYDGSINLHSF